jgi:hypothetical protein
LQNPLPRAAFGRLRRGCTIASLMLTSVCVLPLATALFNPSLAMAQAVNARIVGTVIDPTGAVIPGARVIIREVDTNVVAFDGKTDNAGVYHALTVPAGKYTITAEAPGFKKQAQENINVSLDQGITLDFHMEQGAVDQTVTVSSNTQQVLNQSDATISTTITPSAIQDLPLANRDVTQVFLLTPGFTQGGTANSQNNNQISINGSRTLGTNPLLDGTSVITASTGEIDTLPSPDAISEIKIITSNASAEYGRSSGGTVLMSTKSGTNVYHGGLYDLTRNEDFDANSWANKNNNPVTRRPRDRFFQFGGTIGGPVRIPHIYNGRDKTFFFFNYDQTITPSSSSSTQTVPDALSRSGNFTEFPNQPIIDPQTGKQISCNGQLNVICPGRIDAAAAKYLALLPGPGGGAVPTPTSFGPLSNNYFQVVPIRSTNPKYTGRIDQTLGTKLNIFGAVTKYDNNSPSAVIFNPILNTNSNGSFGDGWNASLGGTYTVSSTMIIEAHMGLYRDAITSAPTSLGINVQNELGFATSPAALTPTVSVSGYAQMGPSTNSTIVQLNQTISYDGSVTKVIGNHTIKGGAQMRNNQFDRDSPTQYNNGQYAFDGSITNPNHSGGNTVNSLADFLLGAVKTSTYELPQPDQRRRNYNLAFFLQDDWKIRPNLTLNLGLRQEYESPITVVGNTYSNFDPSRGILLVAGQNATRALNNVTPTVNLGPHVGFAYTPKPGTVVRGGFSIVYGQVFSNLGSQVNSPGFDIVTNYNNRGPGIAQPFTLSQGMPLTAQYNLTNPAAALGTGSPSSPISTGGPGFFGLDPLSSIQQINVGIQQDLGLGMTLDINYIHTHGLHLPLLITLNQPEDVNSDGSLNAPVADQIASVGTTAANQNTRPFPNLGGITGQGNYGRSQYNALQTTVRRQFNRNVAFVASYTWSHSLDDSSGIYSFSQPSGVNGQIPYVPVLRRLYDYGNSEFDERNVFNTGIQLTSGGNVWTRNFRLGAIIVLHQGLPQTITQSSEFPGVASQRPNGNAVLVRAPAGERSGAAVQYYRVPYNQVNGTGDPAFPFTPTGPFYATLPNGTRDKLVETSLGDSGRGTQNQPGEETVNLSGSRTFKIFENVSFQLRADAFNALNHTNLVGANTSLSLTTFGPAASPTPIFSQGSFGTITSAQPNRKLQLLARIIF